MKIAITFLAGYILIIALSATTFNEIIKKYKILYAIKLEESKDKHKAFNFFIMQYIILGIAYIFVITFIVMKINAIDNKLIQLTVTLSTQVLCIVVMVIFHDSFERQLKTKLEKE